MCIGIPMRVLESDGFHARCAGRGEERAVSLLLVGAVAPGSLVLVHLDSAIRCLDEEEARLIDDALDALELAGRGESFEHLFADLIGREPTLPEHLRPPAPIEETTT